MIDSAPSHEQLVIAANNNKSIQQYRHEKAWWSSCWSEEVIRRNPPMRVEFKHAIVFGSFSEAHSMRRGKDGWGALLKIEVLGPNDFLHPTRITYQLKASSKMRQRWEFRDCFKRILGKHRRLVGQAMRLSKKHFLESTGQPEQKVILDKLYLQLDAFWSAVRKGDRYGAHGIHQFVKELKERTEGYELNFAEEEEERVPEDQISI